MRTRDLVRNAARNSVRSKVRTTLTVLSLFVGAFTLTLTTALGAGVSDYLDRQVAAISTGDLLVITATDDPDAGDGPREYDPDGRVSSGMTGNPLAGGSLLDDDDLDAIAAIDGVANVDPVRAITVDYISTASTAVDTQFELEVNPTASIGRSDLVDGEQLDASAAEPQIVLPEDYVDALGFASAADTVGSAVTLGYTDSAGQQSELDVTVVGVARATLLTSGAGVNASATTTIADAQETDASSGAYPIAVAYITGTGDDGSVTAADFDAVKEALAEDNLLGQTIEDQLGIVQTVITGIIGVLSAFAIVALIAASFGIVNTLFMSVQERTREIGLMKAMGMSDGRVFGLFSLEAAVIGFLGAALGAVVALGVGSAISGSLAAGPLADLPGLSILLFDPVTVAGVIVVVMLIAFLSGVLPARRAARQNPIDSLRYE